MQQLQGRKVSPGRNSRAGCGFGSVFIYMIGVRGVSHDAM